jgi:succinate dehydrogenase/fumarate reductase cytochrome b subunit
MIVHRYLLWSDMVRGIYFEIMLSFLLASCAFSYATLQDQDHWSRLASLAFAINALRLLGRISSTFGGKTWLDALNNIAYFPIVSVINCLLAAWFFHLANGIFSLATVRE